MKLHCNRTALCIYICATYIHDQIIYIIIAVVLRLIVRELTTKRYHEYLYEDTLIEIIWTLLPVTILAFPSLKLLYLTLLQAKPLIVV